MDQLKRYRCSSLRGGKGLVCHLSLRTTWAEVFLWDLNIREILDVSLCLFHYVLRWMCKPTMHDFKVNCIDGTDLGATLLAHKRPYDKNTVILVSRVESKEIISFFIVYCDRASTPPRQESASQKLS